MRMQPGRPTAAYVGFIHDYIALVSYTLIKLTYTSLYKISTSTTEKHASALYQLVIATQEVVIYFKTTYTRTHI